MFELHYGSLLQPLLSELWMIYKWVHWVKSQDVDIYKGAGLFWFHGLLSFSTMILSSA